MSREFIPLSSIDRLMAGMVGLTRNARARAQGRQFTEEGGRRDLGIETDIVGAMAELAVSRYLNRHWAPAVEGPDTNVGDVGAYQVKAIIDPARNLLLRKTDRVDMVYVLCLVALDGVRLLGWAPGEEVKIDQWWRTEGMSKPCYCFPQSDLHTMATLPRLE